jgi:hypothetical protein
LLVCLISPTAIAQVEFEQPPIEYNSSPVDDRVAKLQRRLDAGETELAHDDEHGYLRSVLEKLGVPQESQALVFSQTSFQLRKISPHRPRAIYFNDDVYIGWVQYGDVIELASVDSGQGTVFYTLDQEKAEQPRFVRDRGQCMICHASSRTQGVPGLLVRSVYANASGRPWFGSGTFTTDHRSPFKQRWGGWYVTGKHGSMRHMGNVIAQNRQNRAQIDFESGANRRSLDGLVNTKPYLQASSDVVALMVLEHQTQMQNFITLANYETRQAVHYDEVMNKALDRRDDFRSDSATRRIEAAATKLVDYLLFAEEFELASPVQGDEAFQQSFLARAVKDQSGRSLRDFDLSKRLFKYPCSYLIYSDAFNELPSAVKSEVMQQLDAALDSSERAPHLTAGDRRAIREILIDTLPDFASRSR